MSLFPLLFLCILPKRSEIQQVQDCLTYLRLLGKEDSKKSEIFEAYDILDPPHAKILRIEEAPEGYEEWKAEQFKKKEEADFELKGTVEAVSTPTTEEITAKEI